MVFLKENTDGIVVLSIKILKVFRKYPIIPSPSSQKQF